MIYKFNGGKGAVLCSRCRKIVYIGKPADNNLDVYCEECKRAADHLFSSDIYDKFDFVDDYAESDLYIVIDKETGKYGYINKSGKTVIPCQFDNAWVFKDGSAKVIYKGELGHINKKGKFKKI